MSERKSNRRKKQEPTPAQKLNSSNPVATIAPKIQEEKRTIYPTSTISINWDTFNTKRKVSDELRNEATDLYYEVQKHPAKSIPAIQKLIEEFPDVQIFYDYLMCAYFLDDEDAKALEVATILSKKFPDFVFGKMAYIELCLAAGNLSRVGEYLNDKYTYQEIFPSKGVFHIMEIIQFNFTMGKYFSLLGDTKSSENYLNEIKSLDEESVFIKKLQKIIDKNSGLKFYQRVLKKIKG
jgi:hypothetical protein